MRARLPGPVLALLVLSTLACGKLKPADAETGGAGTGGAGTGSAGTGGGAGTGGRTLVTISGTAAPHPLNAALGASEDFSQLQVGIVNPSDALTNPDAPPVASMTLDTSAANCDAASGCKWSLSGVDITFITLGLVGSLEDKRTGDARVWVKTGTGMGTMAFLKDVRTSPAPIMNRRAFAVSRKLEAKLAAFVSGALGVTLAAGQLEARGFLIGHVVGKLSEGTPDPVGVAGATVVTGVAPGTTFDIIYPNADFSGKGTATAASGIFLMVPKTAMPLVTTWDVVPPSGDTRTWPQHLAGSNPSNAFVIILPANE